MRAVRHHEICNNLDKGAGHPKTLHVDEYVAERLIVDESKKLLFCPVPKAGSSNWKRIFVKLTNGDYEDVEDLMDIRSVHHIHLPTLSDYTEEKRIEIINSYSKCRFSCETLYLHEVKGRCRVPRSYLFKCVPLAGNNT